MKEKWSHWVIAAILVLIAGAVMVAAQEKIEVRVEKDGDDEVAVDVNGVREVVRIDDLADGESRTFDVGDHELVVKRVGDTLKVITEGHGIGAFGPHDGELETQVWVTDRGEEIEIRSDGAVAKRMVVLKGMDDGDETHRTYTIQMDGDDVVIGDDEGFEFESVFEVDGDGDHGMVFFGDGGLHGGKVRYRCEETGSTLLIDEGDAIEDSYICPATGCLMVRVDEPEVHTMIIKNRVKMDDDHDND